MIFYSFLWFLIIPFPYTATYVFIFTGLFIVLLKKVKIFKLEYFEYLFLVYFIFTCITIFLSYDIGRSLNLFIFNILFILSYVSIVTYVKNININKFLNILTNSLNALIYLSILYFSMGIFFYYVLNMPLDINGNIFGLHVDDYRPRFNGLATSPSSYGLLASIYFFMLLRKKNTINIIITLITILLTISWTVYSSLFIALIVYTFFERKRKIFFVMFTIISLSVFVIIYFMNTSELFMALVEYRINNLMNGTHRFFIWDEALLQVQDNLIFGLGYNYTPIFLSNLMGENALSSLHNVFIQLLFEQGIIGVIIFGLFYIAAFYKAYILSKNKRFVFIFYAFILLFIQMNAAILIYSSNFLLLFIILKKLSLTQKEKI